MKIRNIGREDYCTNLRVSIFHSERVGPNNPANITINVTDDSNAYNLINIGFSYGGSIFLRMISRTLKNNNL